MAGKPKDAEKDVTLAFRLPRELHQRLSAAAGERSVSEEMRRRLEASLHTTGADDLRFRSVLVAIPQAATVAASAMDGFNAYVAFEAAVSLLIEVFRPESEQLALEDWWQGTGVAAAALQAVDITKLGRLMEIVRSRHEDKP